MKSSNNKNLFPRSPWAYLEGDKDCVEREAVEDIWVWTGYYHALIPKGSKTDGASILRFFWRIWPPDRGPYARPSWLHDYRYRSQRSFTREQADAEFLDAMKAHGTSVCTRYLFYIALRLFGWVAWNNNKKANQR